MKIDCAVEPYTLWQHFDSVVKIVSELQSAQSNFSTLTCQCHL